MKYPVGLKIIFGTVNGDTLEGTIINYNSQDGYLIRTMNGNEYTWIYDDNILGTPTQPDEIFKELLK